MIEHASVRLAAFATSALLFFLEKEVENSIFILAVMADLSR
jgi:hypothetical protein